MTRQKHTLPLRFRILDYASHAESFTVDSLLRDLKDEYGGEGQFTAKMLSLHCDSLRAVSMIEETDVALRPDDTLLITYRITDYGRTRLVYLPQEWKDAPAGQARAKGAAG